jgi:hypothetical protein
MAGLALIQPIQHPKVDSVEVEVLLEILGSPVVVVVGLVEPQLITEAILLTMVAEVHHLLHLVRQTPL